LEIKDRQPVHWTRRKPGEKAVLWGEGTDLRGEKEKKSNRHRGGPGKKESLQKDGFKDRMC